MVLRKFVGAVVLPKHMAPLAETQESSQGLEKRDKRSLIVYR